MKSQIENIQYQKLNRLEDYERFCFTKNLLKNTYHDFILNLNKKNILAKFQEFPETQENSTTDFTRLIQRIEKWNDLSLPIPLRYLEFIGVKLSSINVALQIDMDAFQDAITFPFYPDCFVVEAADYSFQVGYCQGTTEKEAIDIAKSWKSPVPYHAIYINLKDLKTIVIQSDGHHYTISNPPLVERKKNFLVPLSMENKVSG